MPNKISGTATALGNLRVSPRKLSLVANAIRGRDVSYALVFLKFSRKAVAPKLKKLIESAVSNATNNHGLDPDDLKIDRLEVGRSVRLKRPQTRARGRGTVIHKDWSRALVVLSSVKGDF